MRSVVSGCMALLLAVSLYGQDNQGWRRVDEPEVRNTGTPGTLPSELIIPSGTLVTVRLDQALSSDLSAPGDAFSATLAQPVVVDGIVVARRGQTVAGRVVEAQRAGRIEGVSRLGVEITELSMVDGQQMPVQTQFIRWRGPTSTGRDAAAIAGTTTLGAIIGGAAEGGVGAGIGAAAGAAAGGIGVLLTRGRPTVLYPESVLTFRTEYPVTVSTERAPLVFREVTPEDYARPEPVLRAQAPYPPPDYDYYQPRAYFYPYAPYPPYAFYPPYPYPYFWGSPFYGPGFSFFFGRGFGHGFGHGHFHHGFHR